ncbi:MAG: YccF domain-containing protein [Anaerolineae bacterium]|nr:YccF domain-containing protein [Candidatus Roseilinea sp.]MDW8451022.1 YccF domain-containing protein [Anaerolineae bacterium]
MTRPIVYEQTNRPGCLLQILWFVFIGWWLGAIWVAVAWLLCLTIIGLPLGAAMLNNVPQVMALRGRRLVQVSPDGSVSNAPQINFFIRAIYFLLIGWWLSAIWMVVAYALCLTIIGLPLGFWMFDLVPTLVTLKRA